MCQVHGIRFTIIVDKSGKRIAGGFSNKATPLEKDEKKIDFMVMEIALELSTKEQFDNSLNDIFGIVSYRDGTTIISIPHQNEWIMLSVESELDPSKIIQTVRQNLIPNEITKCMIQ
ncbi:MAG: hypothetical protein HKM23_06415 [Nitrosopumilus sp.]|nr:hypothetical protein [Nitrosopumilus sp.]NNL58913.1 hypothetical protein [Nitrosopumilus sp.]